MTQSTRRDFDMVTNECLVAYDADSGEILSVHEFQSEKGSPIPYEASDINRFRERTIRDFEKRSVKVIRLPEGFTLKPEVSYWVDPACEELRELRANSMEAFPRGRKQRGYSPF